MHEHPLGFSCSDMDDRVADLEQALTEAHLSLCRIHTWLGRIHHCEIEPTPENVSAAIEDAYKEAGERVRI